MTLKSDGKATIDFGWTMVTSAGIIRHLAGDLSVIPPGLFDDLPRIVAAGMPMAGPAARTCRSEGDDRTTWTYLNVKVSISRAEATAAGWLVAPRLTFLPRSRRLKRKTCGSSGTGPVVPLAAGVELMHARGLDRGHDKWLGRRMIRFIICLPKGLDDIKRVIS